MFLQTLWRALGANVKHKALINRPYILGSRSPKVSKKFFFPILLLIIATQLATPSPKEHLSSISLGSLEPSIGAFYGSDSGITLASLNSQSKTSVNTQKIFNVLSSHYQDSAADAGNMMQALHALANYYQQFPEATQLILGLAENNWTIEYAPNTLKTQISGSRFTIDRATVYFDPNSGAKLKFHNLCANKKPFCIASPADALLHELLHVDVILNDSQAFLSQGGGSQHSYPAAHEQRIIGLENNLYSRMSRRDKMPRPIRADHKGHRILVACVTCIE